MLSFLSGVASPSGTTKRLLERGSLPVKEQKS